MTVYIMEVVMLPITACYGLPTCSPNNWFTSETRNAVQKIVVTPEYQPNRWRIYMVAHIDTLWNEIHFIAVSEVYSTHRVTVLHTFCLAGAISVPAMLCFWQKPRFGQGYWKSNCRFKRRDACSQPFTHLDIQRTLCQDRPLASRQSYYV